MTFSGFAEAFFEYSQHCSFFNQWCTLWLKGDTIIAKCGSTQATEIKCAGKTLPQQMSRKTVSDMFYIAELESEMRHGRFLPGLEECIFKRNDDRETYIEKIVTKLSSTNYSHTPSDGCAERGIAKQMYCSLKEYMCIL